MILQKEITEGLIKEVRSVLRLENSRDTWKNKFESPEFKRAASVGERVGSPLNRSVNCGCIDDLFIVLKLIDRNYKSQKNKVMTKECKFRIKNDGMIQLHGFDPITNDNLTDEVAIELLKRNEKHISNFDIFPSNWEDLIEVEQPKKVKEPVKEVEKVEEKIGEVVELTREQELLQADKEVLRQLADSLFEAGKADKKANLRFGVEKLVAYIIENENR